MNVIPPRLLLNVIGYINIIFSSMFFLCTACSVLYISECDILCLLHYCLLGLHLKTLHHQKLFLVYHKVPLNTSYECKIVAFWTWFWKISQSLLHAMMYKYLCRLVVSVCMVMYEECHALLCSMCSTCVIWWVL